MCAKRTGYTPGPVDEDPIKTLETTSGSAANSRSTRTGRTHAGHNDDRRPNAMHHFAAVRRMLMALVALAAFCGAPGLVGSASAAACSTSTGAAGCTINANLTVTAGTLTLEASP